MRELLAEHAKRDARSGESDAQAFTRVFTAKDEQGALLCKAHAIVKASAFDVTRVMVGTPDALHEVSDEQPRAYRQLEELPAQQRRAHETEAQAFARVFSDPVNAELARKAHKQPQPM